MHLASDGTLVQFVTIVHPRILVDDLDEDSHDRCTEEARDGHGHKPGHEDVAEQMPVHCLPGAKPPNCHHRAHLNTQTRGEDLQELEEQRDLGPIARGPVIPQRTRDLQRHLALPWPLHRTLLGHGVAVAGVTVDAHAPPVLRAGWPLRVLAGPELALAGPEVSVHAADGHGVRCVAVVAADGPLARLAHAVAHLGQVQLVQQLLVQARVLVHCVVLAVAVTGDVGRAVAELDLTPALDCRSNKQQ
ncbi:hypothetical protein AAFF_G00054670 [Aldrovandia affinis]|uniref:Uncharacterized protein n=1 Tax=Aldrovandia affinis TaxID=143900 RepID=A0AAD7S0W8_9TELE|nr:hypothetical protein AAFF_G00054670 [Aldrovandia affinis]